MLYLIASVTGVMHEVDGAYSIQIVWQIGVKIAGFMLKAPKLVQW